MMFTNTPPRSCIESLPSDQEVVDMLRFPTVPVDAVATEKDPFLRMLDEIEPRILQRAFLYERPLEYREGVTAAFAALRERLRGGVTRQHAAV